MKPIKRYILVVGTEDMRHQSFEATIFDHDDTVDGIQNALAFRCDWLGHSDKYYLIIDRETTTGALFEEDRGRVFWKQER